LRRSSVSRKSGDVDRDRGINKAGTKLARQTLVELAWFWLRYQPKSKLSLWWRERFGDKGMRGRKVGIVALARKLAIALWRFVEDGHIVLVPRVVILAPVVEVTHGCDCALDLPALRSSRDIDRGSSPQSRQTSLQTPCPPGHIDTDCE